MAGDLFYLTVRTLETPNAEHCITCSVNGFYKNDSTERLQFNPNPSTRSNPCFSYTLAGCLNQLSPTFAKNLQTYIGSILETEPYFITQPPMPVNHWIAKAENKIKVSNAEEVSQTIQPLYGSDPKLSREWNEEYQVVSSFPNENAVNRMQKDRAVTKVYNDFLDAATQGAKAIIDGKLTSLNPNEPLRQHVYVYNQIFFSFAIDTPTDYQDLTSAENFPSFAQANHDITGLQLV